MNRLFLVEDEASLVELYRMLFEDRGYEVEVATDGQEALDKLFQGDENYDLIVLDIMIPKISGVKVLEKLKGEGSRFADTPVIMLTNMGEDDVRKKSIKLGAAGFFVKANYSPSQFIESVEEILQEDNEDNTTIQE